MPPLTTVKPLGAQYPEATSPPHLAGRGHVTHMTQLLGIDFGLNDRSTHAPSSSLPNIWVNPYVLSVSALTGPTICLLHAIPSGCCCPFSRGICVGGGLEGMLGEMGLICNS